MSQPYPPASPQPGNDGGQPVVPEAGAIGNGRHAAPQPAPGHQMPQAPQVNPYAPAQPYPGQPVAPQQMPAQAYPPQQPPAAPGSAQPNPYAQHMHNAAAALKTAPETQRAKAWIVQNKAAIVLGAILGVVPVVLALIVGGVLAGIIASNSDVSSLRMGTGMMTLVSALSILGGSIVSEFGLFGFGAGGGLNIPPVVLTPILLAVLTIVAGVAARRAKLTGFGPATLAACVAWVCASIVWALAVGILGSTGGGFIDQSVSVGIGHTMMTLIVMVALPVLMGTWTWTSTQTVPWRDSLLAAIRVASVIVAISTVLAIIGMLITLPSLLHASTGETAIFVIVAMGVPMVFGVLGRSSVVPAQRPWAMLTPGSSATVSAVSSCCRGTSASSCSSSPSSAVARCWRRVARSPRPATWPSRPRCSR
ncbi:hypothetical protein H8R18_08285 [Nanchangia anserum]|uniref:hypothetical protein n=1 Tax=Nanchangia anserum TaxID=2692125 RepID=UPI00188419AF|nr:hypothetical protein [Nanchangia anserum]QOX81706.1 hypothetical protein H8R18_08285 [Nanchangia anserum]